MNRRTLLLMAMLALGFCLSAAEPPLEYQVKAVCVLNAARFVTWPASAFSSANSPLTIGVLGDNPFGPSLENAVKGETIRGRRIVVRQVALAEAATTCHILFICRSEAGRLDLIVRALGGASVLTISETEHFAKNDGMLGLALDHGKIRFELNPEAASRARLKFDSQFILLTKPAR